MAGVSSCDSSQTFSADKRCRLIRPFVGICVLGLILLGSAGCGGDDEPKTAGAPDKTSGPVTQTQAESTETVVEGTTTDRTSPEQEVPGGPGDEEPAYSQALLTGRNGRINPPLVQVPPYIAIRVELHSADGVPYGLRFGNAKLQTRARETDSVLLGGLRPGRRVIGTPVGGGGNRVVISASAEPGP
jgi:hypothetical protein